MNTIQVLKEELASVEAKINDLQISADVTEAIGLFNKRVLLGKQIAQLQWNQMSAADKEKRRAEDLNLTEKYFNKYPEDVRNKFLYKEQYILMLKKIKTLVNAGTIYTPLFRALLIVLDNAEYINIHDNICVKAIFEQIEQEGNEDITEIVRIYKELLNIPFEI